MNSIFNYVLESGVVLLLLYCFYFLVLRRRAEPAFNRFYLLFTLLFSLIIPLLSIPISLGAYSQEAFNFRPGSPAWNLLPELLVNGEKVGQADSIVAVETDHLHLLWVVYLAGVGISMLLTGFKVRKIIRLIRQHSFYYPLDSTEYKIANTGGQLPTFSFLKYIFWDDSFPLKSRDTRLILRHELAHIRQFHSFDNLLLEALTAFLWFNPAIYTYRYSLRQVHEHLADRYALADAEPESYFSLMVRQTLRQANIPLASSFFQHNTLNRIKMLKTKPNRTALRAALAATILGIVFFVVACQDDNATPLVNTETKAETADPFIADHLISLTIEENNGAEKSGLEKSSYSDKYIRYMTDQYTFTISDFADEAARGKVMVATKGKSAKDVRSFILSLKDGLDGRIKPTNELTKAILDVESWIEPEKEPINSDLQSEGDEPVAQANTSRIFEIVEESPTPVGGMEKFYDQLGKNTKYPELAKSKGISGRVYVQFVVETDGSVSEVKTVKGIGGGCDEEAIRVMKDTRWNPGKQRGREVAVRMVIPMMFNLEKEDPTEQ